MSVGSCLTDCTHENEPGCAVREAVRRGELSLGQLESYLRLRREAERRERFRKRRRGN